LFIIIDVHSVKSDGALAYYQQEIFIIYQKRLEFYVKCVFCLCVKPELTVNCLHKETVQVW